MSHSLGLSFCMLCVPFFHKEKRLSQLCRWGPKTSSHPCPGGIPPLPHNNHQQTWAPKESLPPPPPRSLCLKLLHPDHSAIIMNNVSSTPSPSLGLRRQVLRLSGSQVPGTQCPILARLRKGRLACANSTKTECLPSTKIFCLSQSLYHLFPLPKDGPFGSIMEGHH